MSDRHARPGALARGAVPLAGLLWFAGCASDDPGRGAPTAGLFHVSGPASGQLAPGPSGRWYVERDPHYAQNGMASWSPQARGGLSGLLGHLFHRTSTAPPTAVIDARSRLPAPSLVEITNLRNGARTTVRVDASANLGGPLIRLDAAAAGPLGAPPTEPLYVRVRFARPVVALSLIHI